MTHFEHKQTRGKSPAGVSGVSLMAIKGFYGTGTRKQLTTMQTILRQIITCSFL